MPAPNSSRPVRMVLRNAIVNQDAGVANMHRNRSFFMSEWRGRDILLQERDDEPKVKVGKIPKDEPPKKEEEKPKTPSVPFEGPPDPDDDPATTPAEDTKTKTSAPKKGDGPSIVMPGDDDPEKKNFDEWWDGATSVPSDVTLDCPQDRQQHKVELNWTDKEHIGYAETKADAEAVAKGAIAGRSASAEVDKNIAVGVPKAKIKLFLENKKNWKCAPDCRLEIKIVALEYRIRIYTTVTPVYEVNTNKIIKWMVDAYHLHHIRAVFEVECKK